MEIDEKRVMNWMKLYNFGDPVQIHASGHAAGSEIRHMIESVKPKKLIPIHTENVDWFKNKYSNTEQPVLGKKIYI